MDALTQPPPSSKRQRAALAVLAAAAIVAGLALLFAPHYRMLTAYGLYVIPAHLLISFLPHEPGILYVAKLYPPWSVAVVGVAGTIVAVFLDYWLIGSFVESGRVRSRMDDSRVYRIAERIFRKAPFLLIFGSAIGPVPFYPVKIIAIASGYPFWLFLTAATLGRLPRFYVLAIGGREFQPPNVWLLVAAVLLEVSTVLGILKMRRARSIVVDQLEGDPP